jgi:hypothetical protein
MVVWLRGPRCVSLEQENILWKERSGRLFGRKEVKTMEEELVARREKRQRIIKQHMGDPPREERPMEVKDLVKGFAEVG